MLKTTLCTVLSAVMPVFVLFVLLIPTIGGAAGGGAVQFIIEPIDYDIPSEVAAAAEQGKTLIVMFGQNGCPYCAKMRNRVFPHAKVAAQYAAHFVLFEINIKGDLEVVSPAGQAMTEKQYAAEMRARATPLFVYYDKDGHDVLRLTGYQEPGIFMTAGCFVTSEAYKDGTSFLTFVRSGK